MTYEEFSQFGCYKCGHHDFTRPIEKDVLVCEFCNAEFDTAHIGLLDGDFWMQLKAENQGEPWEPPSQVRYHNEEQFVNQFVENVESKEEVSQ